MKHISTLSLAFFWASVLSIAQTAPHTDYVGAGHTTGITVTTSGTGFFGEGENTINATGLNQHYRDAARFLGQAPLEQTTKFWKSYRRQVLRLGLTNRC